MEAGRGRSERGRGREKHKYDEWSMRDPRERDEKAKQQRRGRRGAGKERGDR